ncbi:MAG: calmodulin-binding protein [Thermoguttaceae bacterium]
MFRRLMLALGCAAVIGVWSRGSAARADEAFGRQWGQNYSTQEWSRLYHYPYVYYPQNFWGPDYYRSSGNMYYRYPPEMQIPVYNRQWHNEYPQVRRYYAGGHFSLDTF